MTARRLTLQELAAEISIHVYRADLGRLGTSIRSCYAVTGPVHAPR